jgi:2-polyprenyl-3-methyl-5-hydroxy-6-metoxy-1,4-benzoquinol methylase
MTTKPQCPICSGASTSHFSTAQDVEYFTTPESFSFYRCEACDVLFVHPMPFDRLNEIYPANYYSFKGAGTDSLALRIKRSLDDRAFRAVTKGLNGETLSALDVGGGSGWLLDDLKRAEPRVTHTTVVDIDPGAHAAALAKGHEFYLGPISEFETDRRFDLILMLNLIEHVPDPVGLLRQAKDLLKPGGRIWIKTPNYDSLDARIFKNRSWGGFHTPRHFVLFTRDSLIHQCERLGFQVLKCDYTQGAPFWTVSAINELRRMGVVEVSAKRPSLEHPLTPLLHLAFAALDFIRMPVSKTSQMNVWLTAD